MSDKPKQWGWEYARIFQDESVVAAYRYRPTYPPELFSFLSQLIPSTGSPRRVLDAGCGTGFVARPLAPLVDQVDAIDVSDAMIQAAKLLPGGDYPTIRWITAPIETAPLQHDYALDIIGKLYAVWAFDNIIHQCYTGWLI